MKSLNQESQVDELFDRPAAIIYKHSTACPVSSSALREMEAFAASHPEHELHRLDVLEHRSVSNYVESKTGVRHESPQLLVVEDGRVVWSTSHFGVTAAALAAKLPRSA